MGWGRRVKVQEANLGYWLGQGICEAYRAYLQLENRERSDYSDGGVKYDGILAMAIWEMSWVAVEGVRAQRGPAAPRGAAGQGPAARAGAEDPRGDDMGSWALGKVGAAGQGQPGQVLLSGPWCSAFSEKITCVFCGMEEDATRVLQGVLIWEGRGKTVLGTEK